MTISNVSRCVLCISAAVVILVGCSSVSTPNSAGAIPQSMMGALQSSRSAAAAASGYKILFDFGGLQGAGPGDLTPLDSSLYGTTGSGGTHKSGTAFDLKTDGKVRVFYDFSSQNGLGPSGLTYLNGTFYGTMYSTKEVSGHSEGGTVFAVTKSGVESTLYVFQGSPDGSLPFAGVTLLNGMLYGTTQSGGTSPCPGLGNTGCGTVFSITTAGQESVLHSFKGFPHDGSVPQSPLLDLNGTLYGTTTWGGSGGCSNSDKLGCGAVFSITPSGQEHVLHSFKGGTDGAYPYARLLNVNGTMYGTTGEGGTGCYGGGCGTVFSITPSGNESVIYRFKGGRDGNEPSAGLAFLNGKLYGTTIIGGTTGTGCQGGGCGIIFSVTTTGKEIVLHRFTGIPPDGKFPESDLTTLNGNVYGAAAGGSRHQGIVFEWTP